MSTQFNFATVSQSRVPFGGPVASSATRSCPGAQLSVDHYTALPTHGSVSIPGPTDEPVNDAYPPMPSTRHFAPLEEHLEALAGIPRWLKHLDDHFTDVFKESVLSHRLIDAMVARTLQIIDSPTQDRICGLALAVCTHWMRLQCRCKNPNAYATEIVTFISRIAHHLGRVLVHAKTDFLDALNYLCIEKLKLTWRWYVSLVSRGVQPMPRKNLFTRVMTVVARITYLFHGGMLRYGGVLDGVRYIATMSPWLDAVAVIYALLRELGPNFTLEQDGWDFVQRLLAELSPLTVRRVHSDPLCQLVSAINTLVTEWHSGTQAALYHTHPKGNSQFPAYHPQT